MSCSISTTPASDSRSRSRSFHLRLEQQDSRSLWEPPKLSAISEQSPPFQKIFKHPGEPSPSASSSSSVSSAASSASSTCSPPPRSHHRAAPAPAAPAQVVRASSSSSSRRSHHNLNVMSHAQRFAYAEKGYRSSTPPIAKNRDRRANSTSSVFVSNTIASPDDFLTIKSVAIVIRKLLEMGQFHANRANNIRDFDLDMEALNVTPRQLRELTGVDTINRFVKRIFVRGQLSHECNIMALIYIDRLLYRTQMCLTYRNWRHIVLGAYIMASKVWDDLSMINKDFTIVCPMFTLEEINTLEIRYLELLQYHLTVSGRLYAEYYFKLRDVFNLYMGNNGANPFPLKPLSKRESTNLLKTSTDSEQCVQQEMRRRRATCDDTTLARPDVGQFILPMA